MAAARQVTIREVALRDGLQSEREFVPTEKKLAVIDALSQAGIQCMETTSFVSPRAIPQLQDAAELMSRVARGNIIHEVLVPNLKGAQKAIVSNVDRVVVFISASEAHNQANVGCSIGDSLADLQTVYSLLKQHQVPAAGIIAVSFGCPYQGRVQKTDVLKIAQRFVDWGADRVMLADTTGMASPAQISEMIGYVQSHLPDVPLGLHLHNNRGVAMANLYAGYLAGITQFDTSLGGIGGCPNVPLAAGNLATEDVVFMFEEMGVATGLDLPGLIRAAQLLEKILQHPLPGRSPTGS
ncbi:hydroxymethylglutaryl-CoA lyase [bacterium]|nr:hydroxymethylglutaryl-CoA lyase [bacterium]